MSSSHLPPIECDAIVSQHSLPTGPLRLPLSDVDRFVIEFNETYARLGMRIDPAMRVITDDESQRRMTDPSYVAQ